MNTYLWMWSCRNIVSIGYILGLVELPPFYVTIQLTINHSMDLGIMLYTLCEPCLVIIFAPGYIVIWVPILSKFQA